MLPLSIFSVNLLSDNLLLLASVLVFFAILITKVGARFGAPSLLLFLILGMLVGADGLGVRFNDFEVAESIGHFAMTIILDCSELAYISSSGLRLFLTLRKAAANKGGNVIVKSISDDIRQVFMMTGFLNLFKIED